MATVDWVIVALYLAVVTVIGLLFVKKASGSIAEYFVAGRNLPWWLAGTSLVATSFAADTPLAITGFVAKYGIAGNWIWWNQVVVWVLAVVFFAQLWRRAGILTDAELIELRYTGNAAAFLRGFRAFTAAMIFSTGTLAWVMLAMQKIVAATMAPPETVLVWQQTLAAWLNVAPESLDLWKLIVLCVLFCVATFYTIVSGYWGIVITDFLQLIVALFASALFAWFAIDHVGGIAALKTQLAATGGATASGDVLNFFPRADAEWMGVWTFVIFLGVLWWGDCNGFAAQRLFSTRSDRDATLTALWYSIAHFVIRPWPWIIVALVTLVVYPGLEDPEMGYPNLMMEILPAGLRGLMVASLLAAFMSTVDTHLNWNASYFVNDVYRRFFVPNATERQSVRMSRISTAGFALFAIVIAYWMETIGDAWLFLFNLQAGVGMVMMLRWLWWRINVWSEISAMGSSLVVTPGTRLLSSWYDLEWSNATCIFVTVLVTGVVWVTVTLLTRPTDLAKLDAFYRRVRPHGFWRPIAARCPDVAPPTPTWQTLLAWLGGVLALYALMFGVGSLLLQRVPAGLSYLAVAALVGVAVVRMPVVRNLLGKPGAIAAEADPPKSQA